MMKNILKKNNSVSRIMAVLIVLAMSSMQVGCDKMLDLDSTHLVKEDNKWKDLNDARASLLGIYGLLRSALAENNAHWMYGELRQGNFTSPTRRDLQELIDGNLNSSYPLIQNLSNWRRFYAVINAANIFIENSSKIVDEDSQYTALQNRIDIAQARAIKGYAYFLLARIWGDVPIWSRSYEGAFPKIDASSHDVVLTYAERELKAAAAVLPFRYGYAGDEIFPSLLYFGETFGDWDGVLFNRVSVYAILAHLMAWKSNYFDAAVHAEYVMNNANRVGAVNTTTANLVRSNGFFFQSTGSHLVAFPFKWSALESSLEGHIENLTLATPLVNKQIPDIYVPADRILQLFNEPNDERFSLSSTGAVSSAYFTGFGGLRPIFSKINVMTDGESDNRSFPLFSSAIVFSRLEDIALLRAEALAVLREDISAANILNQLRRSRGLSNISASDDLIDKIFEERRRELMGEGWYWYDLVRYQKIKRNDPQFNALIDNKGIFWPISQEVLRANPELNQNPYWN